MSRFICSLNRRFFWIDKYFQSISTRRSNARINMSQSFFRWFLFATGILKEVEVEKKAPKGFLDSTLSFFGVKDNNPQKIIEHKVMLNTSSPALYILLFIFTIFVIYLVIKIRQFRSRGNKVDPKPATVVKNDKRKSWLFNRAPAVTENQNDTQSESKVVQTQPSKAEIISKFFIPRVFTNNQIRPIQSTESDDRS